MLIISRRRGETLVIGENIEIEILDCSTSQVKLGIRAPRMVQVWRKEIQLTRTQNLASVHRAGNLEELRKSLQRGFGSRAPARNR